MHMKNYKVLAVLSFLLFSFECFSENETTPREQGQIYEKLRIQKGKRIRLKKYDANQTSEMVKRAYDNSDPEAQKAILENENKQKIEEESR